MIIVHVAEKPSVAKTLGEILSQGCRVESRAGLSIYNRIYCFSGSDLGGALGGRGAQHRVTSVTGHLKELDFVAPYTKWGSCTPGALFTAPVALTVPASKEPLERQLKMEAMGATCCVLWLDCDREGEAIADQVRAVMIGAKDGLRVLRAKFSSLVPAEVLRAVRSAGPLNDAAAAAVSARRELDLRLGAAFTRMQTFALAGRFETLVGNTVSYGPCQSPTLGFIVERYRAAMDFVAEDFWTLDLEFGQGQGQGPGLGPGLGPGIDPGLGSGLGPGHGLGPGNDNANASDSDFSTDDDDADVGPVGAQATRLRAAARFAARLRGRVQEGGGGGGPPGGVGVAGAVGVAA